MLQENVLHLFFSFYDKIKVYPDPKHCISVKGKKKMRRWEGGGYGWKKHLVLDWQ